VQGKGHDKGNGERNGEGNGKGKTKAKEIFSKRAVTVRQPHRRPPHTIFLDNECWVSGQDHRDLRPGQSDLRCPGPVKKGQK
jgi:hypothetical protein